MTQPRASLAFWLARDLLFAVLACAAALMVALSVQLDMTKRELREASLDGAAQNIAVHLKTAPDGSLRLVAASGNAWNSAGYPTLVFGRNGRLIYQQPQGLDPALIAALADQGLVKAEQPHRLGAIRFFTLAVGEKQIVGAALHTGSDADARVIEVFKDEHAADVLIADIVHNFPYRSARVLLPLLALLLLASILIIRRRTRPIAEVAAIAETIGPHTLSLRLPERELPAEVLPIVRGVNRALARLERDAEMQRQFLRQAAHQLRTPMTVLSARVDLLDDPKLADMLRGDVKEMARIVSQLVQLNELDQLPDCDAKVADLGAVAEAVRDELAARAARRGITIALAGPTPPVLVAGDPNIIEVAVRNLAENALQHSPAGSRIDLLVVADASLAVVDAGPGVPNALHTRIFEPFWSGDPRGGSAGLGLTIVRRVAERCGASVTVAAAPGGGALFKLHFQAAPSGDGGLAPAAMRASLPASLVHRRRRATVDGPTG